MMKGRLRDAGYLLVDVGFWLLATGFCLLVTGFLFLVYWSQDLSGYAAQAQGKIQMV
jgi:hypothetical protein